ncbi:hypothetical protein CK203_023160 [Vitis vinifera]|uniref:Uncharacterized protein n=1 Tax=Vitis vinifera TaxID=29760 RepID=A0A438J1U1_VITVI|nr:hypothetical protein CK203_023160 [Vitis vinifera]
MFSNLKGIPEASGKPMIYCPLILWYFHGDVKCVPDGIAYLLVGLPLFRMGFLAVCSSAAEWAQEEDLHYWFDQHMFETESLQDGKRWSSQPHASSAHLSELKPLYRTSSYPEQQQPQQLQQHQQQQHHYSSEPILVPKSSFTSYPPTGGRSLEGSPNHHSRHISHLSGGPQIALSPSNLPPFSNPQLQLPSLHHGSQFGGNLPQFAPGLSVNSRPPSQWVNQTNIFPGDHPSILNNLLQQQLPHQNGLMPPQLMLQQQPQQHRLHHPVQPSFGHLSGLQSQLFNPHLSPAPPIMNKYEAMLGIGDLRDQRPKSMQKGRPNHRFLNRALILAVRRVMLGGHSSDPSI